MGTRRSSRSCRPRSSRKPATSARCSASCVRWRTTFRRSYTTRSSARSTPIARTSSRSWRAPRRCRPMSDLERFWFELQREMIESGHIARFKTKVVKPDGKPLETTVVARRAVQRVRAVGLRAVPARAEAARDHAAPAHQRVPLGREAAGRFERRRYVSSVVDPTRGVLLSIYAQRPTCSSVSSAANRSAT